jgi:hypothetical protein
MKAAKYFFIITDLALLITCLAVIPTVPLGGQTCCSGGVPLSSNLGLPPAEGKVLQAAVSYDLNVLETLKTGASVLEDDARSRRTHSVLMQFGYNFNRRYAVDVFFSWVRQEREINQFGNRDLTATHGIGDAVVLFKYRTLDLNDGQTTLTTALGVKAPLGAPDLRRDDGLSIIADLQPGSGAWDGIAWGQLVQNLGFRPSMSFSMIATASFKGKNDNYLNNQTYQFGDEWQLMAGLSDRLFLGKAILDPTLTLRFRNAGRDRIDGQDLPSTGGAWLFINPGVSYWFTPDWSFNINAELPLYARVDGTQVSPSYRINTGFFFRLSFKDHSDFIVNPLK